MQRILKICVEPFPTACIESLRITVMFRRNKVQKRLPKKLSLSIDPIAMHGSGWSDSTLSGDYLAKGVARMRPPNPRKKKAAKGVENAAVSPLITTARGWLLYLIRENRGDTVGFPRRKKEPSPPSPLMKPRRKDS